MHVKRTVNNYVALLLGFAGLMAGCGSLTPPMERDVLLMTSKAYDLPSDMDPNVMTSALWDSFLDVLRTPPTVIEGAMPTPTPLTPSGFHVEDKIFTLDRLGSVHFPHVVCPHSLAMIEGLHGSSQAVYRYAACLQPYRDGFRLYLVETRAALAFDTTTASPSASFSDLLTRLADRVIKGLPHARVAAPNDNGEVTTTLKEEHNYDRSVAQGSAKKTPSLGTATSHEIEPEIESISPLICLALTRNEVVVRSRPGEGHIIGTVTSDLAVGDNSPLDGAYVHIKTEQGLTGWAQRSELHWRSCPIG